MLVNNDINWVSMTDKAIVSAIGSYIKQKRLEINKTQAQVAKDAGINRWTLSQIENGESITLTTLIRILRVLNLLHILEIFSIKEQISPIEYAKMKEKKKQRATSKSSKEDKNEDLGW